MTSAFCQQASQNARRRVEDDIENIVLWVQSLAKEHKTLRTWEQFLFCDFLAYLAFRTAVRTGDFMLRLHALRRIAPIFCITGKDRYQFLVAEHLKEIAQMPLSEFKILSELFSVSLAQSRIGLDETQEIVNRLFKTVTKKIIPTTVEKLAPVAELREAAQFEVSGSWARM